MRSIKVIHPYLIAGFPILFLFSHNRGWFDGYRDVAYLLALSIGGAALLLLFLRALLKNEQKSGLLVTLFATLFYTYGHLYEAAYEHTWNFFPVSRHPYLLLTYGAIFLIGAFFIVRSRRSLNGMTSFLNITSITLIFLTLGTLIAFGSGNASKKTFVRPEATLGNETSEKRDIYYILLDSYQGASELQDYYGFDNTPFIKELETRGFFVAKKSLSNYESTTISLPSALNMDYLHNIWKGREELVAIDELTPATRDTAVLRFLKAQDYTSVHIGHWHIPTFRNEYADISHEVGRFGDAFIQLVVRTTALSPFMQNIFQTNIHKEVLEAFSMLEKTAKLDSPKYVYAHIIAPHADYVFGPNGEERAHRYDLKGDAYKEWAKGAYIDQLQFVNKRVLEAVDTILTETGTDPIIVIHSDHGNGDTIKTNFRNLIAVRAPGKKDIGLYDTITPVNIFRLIFNAYFDAEYPLLPDRAYHVIGGDNAGYDISHSEDITDQVKFD